MLSGTLRLPDDVEDPVSLAIAVFSCRDCREDTLRFPELLAHPCLRGIRYWRGYHDDYTSVATDCANVLDMPGALDLSSLYVDTQSVGRLGAIIDACGLDPCHATQQDLEQCEARLYCAHSRCVHDDCVKFQGCDWLSAVRFVDLRLDWHR